MVTVGIGPPGPPDAPSLSSATSEHSTLLRRKQQDDPKVIYFAAHLFKLNLLKSALLGGQCVNL